MAVVAAVSVETCRAESPGSVKVNAENREAGKKSEKIEKKVTRIVRGTGYVRGRSTRTLKNKYAAYVSKVNFYSQARVKKGDVIIEYEDFDLRNEITKLENSIAEKEQALKQAKLDLELTKLDPLPSTYRNLKLKKQIAEERLKRHKHELDVYTRLSGNKIVSDLKLREKRQQVADYEGDLLCLDSDMQIINKGLSKLLVQASEEDVRDIEVKLQSLRKELALAQEKRKYYKLVSPIDGVCITNSDYVHCYDAVGTSAAVIHRDDRKLIYAYFDERDIRHVVEGKPCRFRSNQYGDEVVFEVMPYEVKKTFYSYGDRLMMYAKFRLLTEPKPLRIDSIGTVEIDVTE